MHVVHIYIYIVECVYTKRKVIRANIEKSKIQPLNPVSHTRVYTYLLLYLYWKAIILRKIIQPKVFSPL